MSEYLDPEDEVIRLIFVDCILPICDQKRCYLFVAIISSKEFFIMHGVMNFKSTWIFIAVVSSQKFLTSSLGLRIHVDDNKVIWKISVQLLAF